MSEESDAVDSLSLLDVEFFEDRSADILPHFPELPWWTSDALSNLQLSSSAQQRVVPVPLPPFPYSPQLSFYDNPNLSPPQQVGYAGTKLPQSCSLPEQLQDLGQPTSSEGDHGVYQLYPWAETRRRPGALPAHNNIEQQEVGTDKNDKDHSGARAVRAVDLDDHIWVQRTGLSPAFLRPQYASASRNQLHELELESVSDYQTAVSDLQSVYTAISGSNEPELKQSLLASEWRSFLETKNLIPDPLIEQDWSGRGQHAEYTHSDKDEIPLLEEGIILGHSGTAIVDSVRCRRIRLARKRVTCTRGFRQQDAIQEVEHLQRLHHAHIVRVVGTYVLPKTLAILLYPVADWNLETFLEMVIDNEHFDLRACSHCRFCNECRRRPCSLRSDTPWGRRHSSLAHSVMSAYLLSFFSCLVDTVHYLHRKFIKHKDIKPRNILIKRTWKSCCGEACYTLYLADFGISRAYSSLQESATDKPTSFTLSYAAPEVIRQERRDLSADIFSLGCVFAEMLAVLASLVIPASPSPKDNELERLAELLASNKEQDDSYQANLPALTEWLSLLVDKDENEWWQESCLVVGAMMDEKPERRPTAEHLSDHFPPLHCCLRGAPEFMVEEEPAKTKSTS